MKFAEWVDSVPTEISDDPVWKLEVYRLALFALEVAQRDARVLEQSLHMRSVAERLSSSAAMISTNLREGTSRDDSSDRSKFYEYALDSARECREWYETARTALPDVVAAHRLELLVSIVGMITSLMPDQRTRPTREVLNERGITANSRRVLFDEHIPFA